MKAKASGMISRAPESRDFFSLSKYCALLVLLFLVFPLSCPIKLSFQLILVFVLPSLQCELSYSESCGCCIAILVIVTHRMDYLLHCYFPAI